MAAETIQEAQRRLLQKRDQLKATESPILSTLNSDEIETLEDILGRLRVRGESAQDDAQERKQNRPLMGIPPRYSSCSFDTFEGAEEQKRALLDLGGESVVLTGRTGCGKTHLAVAMLKKSERYGNLFTTVPELLMKARASFRDGAEESEEQLIERFCAPDLLVLDDLGAEKTSEYSIATLELIIDRRMRYERRTIITTNLSLEQIEAILGARIASRLSEMKIVKINLPDWRKKR
jgi:DNA replication protein DnaC